MQIGHLELFARNPAATADFYLDVLGFQPVTTDGPTRWVALGDDEVAIRPAHGAAAPPNRYDQSDLAMVLYTEDLDAEAKRLEAAGVTFGAPDGSPRCLTFQDPDGRWLQLVNPSEQR